MDVPPKGGFGFDLRKRNAMLANDVVQLPPFGKTGTIVGLICKDGVVLGADTRATEGTIVADKNCKKIHYLAPNIYCCGAAAETEAVTSMVSSQLQFQQRCHPDRDYSRVVTALTYLKRHDISAALVLGGVDFTGPHLHTIYPKSATNTDGSTDDKLGYATIGSGSLAAMAIFESKYKEGLTRDEGVQLATEAICAGIFNDLGSGSNVDIWVITKEGTYRVSPKPPSA